MHFSFSRFSRPLGTLKEHFHYKELVCVSVIRGAYANYLVDGVDRLLTLGQVVNHVNKLIFCTVQTCQFVIRPPIFPNILFKKRIN